MDSSTMRDELKLMIVGRETFLCNQILVCVKMKIFYYNCVLC